MLGGHLSNLTGNDSKNLTKLPLLVVIPAEAGIQGRKAAAVAPGPPLSRVSGNLKYPSFRGLDAVREPGIQAHRPPPTWEWPGFIGSGPGPADHPGMTKK